MPHVAKIAIASLAVITAATPAAGEGDPITSAMLPIMAATRIFALENHLHGDIAAADEDEGHIGERFEVNHAPGEKCTFTMRRRDGPIIEFISFDRLSTEYKVSPQGGLRVAPRHRAAWRPVRDRWIILEKVLCWSRHAFAGPGQLTHRVGSRNSRAEVHLCECLLGSAVAVLGFLRRD